MKHSKDNMEQIRMAMGLFQNQGVLERLRKQSTSAEQWDVLIAHWMSLFTGLDVEAGTARHLRAEIDCKWYAGDRQLFTEPKTLLIVSSEDLGRLVDQAVEQALNCRQSESTIEPEEIEQTPKPESVKAGTSEYACMVA